MRFITLCLIVLLLIGSSGCMTLFAADKSANEARTDSLSNELAADNISPSVTPVQLGISGTITADILVDQLATDAEKTIFLGTTVGLYIISDGKVEHFIYTPEPVIDIALIDDFTGDGMREVVIGLTTTYYPGLQCYDISTGEELWHFIPTNEALVNKTGFTTLQTATVDLETVADLNADNVMEVAVASGRCLNMIDGKTGNPIWAFETPGVGSNDTDINGDLIQVNKAGDVNGDGVIDLAAGRSGFLYMINGKNGSLLLQKRLIEDKVSVFGNSKAVTKNDIKNFKCFQVDGRNKAAVSYVGSNVVQLVDLQDGSFGWESTLSYASVNGGISLSLSNDITGDNVADILTFWKESLTTRISLLSGYTGTAVWSVALATQNTAAVAEATILDDKQTVLVPLGRSGQAVKVAILDLADGEIIKTLEMMSAAVVSSTRVDENSWAAGIDSTSFILASNDGDLMGVSSQGGRLWYLPRVNSLSVEKGQFNSDSVADLVLYSDRVLSVRDGLSTSELWRYDVPYDDLLASGGLRFVKVIPDVNADQNQDILACQGANILVFDGNKGNILVNFSVGAQITSADIIHRGNSIAFIAGTSTDIFVVTPEGKLLYSLPYSKWLAEAKSSVNGFLVLDDINRDGISDLAIIYGNKVFIAESSLSGVDLTFIIGATDIQPDGIRTILSLEISADIDGDGYREIYLRFTREVEKKELYYSVVVSPSSGKKLLDLDEKDGLLLNPGCADFNNDGYLDSLAFWVPRPTSSGNPDGMIKDGGYKVNVPISNKLPERPRLAIISGIDQASLWEHDYGLSSGNQGFIPAIPYFDMEGGKVPYLLFTEVVRQSEYSGNMFEVIRVVNVLTNETVREITVASKLDRSYSSFPEGSMPINDSMADYYTLSSDSAMYSINGGASTPSSYLKAMKDLDGDGNREIALFVRQSTGFSYSGISTVEVHPVIANIAGGEIMSYFLLPCSELVELDYPGKIGGLGDNGLFYVFDTVSTLQITSPAEKASVPSPVNVSWQNSTPGYFNLIFIDNVLSGVMHQSKAAIEVNPGSHTLTVYSLDRYGRVSIQSTDLRIKKQPLYLLPVIVLIILSLAAVFSARIIRAVDRRHLRKSGG